MRTLPPLPCLALAAALAAGCSDATEAPAERDPCQAAAAHLSGCAEGLPVIEWAGCDPVEAERVLATPCGTVNAALADPKADVGNGVARFACRLGYFAACEVPACEDDTAAEPPAADAPCAEWLRYDGCGVCEYYRCRDARQPCGDDGYLLGYVGKYCNRFASVTEPRVSPAANAWLKRVRRCLVTWLEDNVPYDATCERVDREGTDSHAECYVETGFCDLSPLDWFGIVQSIDPGDLPLRVLLSTAHGCIADWFGPQD